jgi:hypothetical protein
MQTTQNLIHCDHEDCTAEFFLVPARQFPTLCLDHSDQADREANGWTPENSVD